LQIVGIRLIKTFGAKRARADAEKGLAARNRRVATAAEQMRAATPDVGRTAFFTYKSMTFGTHGKTSFYFFVFPKKNICSIL
jgi:hypothetical protein